MINIFGWYLNISRHQPDNQLLLEYMMATVMLSFVYFLTRRFFKPAHVYSIVNDPFKYPDGNNERHSVKQWIKAIKRTLFSGHKKERYLQEEIQKKQSQLNQIKYFDILTKLPNRVKLVKDFENRLAAHTIKDSFAEMSIFILDIDRFRIINELHGREAGDKVLIKIIERLHTLLGERAVIARESEDEIYILVDEVDEKQTLQLGREIVDLFTKPFKVNQSPFYVTASIGISRYPETAQDMEALLQQAEIAMYKVKHSGKNNYHLFMTDDAAAIERKRRIEFGLKEALMNNELYLVYQPKVEMTNGEIYGVEALLRWENPILGLVSPVEFIPIAEETGMINEIGYWVIYEAIRQAKEWQKQNMYLHIAVNVSALQFEDPYFVTRIKNVLELFEVDANQFIVEITESIMQNVEQANRVINELHKIGINVAIDDFGTGYSSLSVLNNVFVDIVKIDKSFIDHVISKENTASLVKTMIQMGKSLNFKIIAEGIESLEQSNFLKENACEYGQGYYYSKPVLPSEVSRLTEISLNGGHN